MNAEEKSFNVTFLESSINNSIDFVTSSVLQLLQMISCLVSVIVIGKIVGFLLNSKRPTDEIVTSDVVVVENDECKVDSKHDETINKSDEVNNDDDEAWKSFVITSDHPNFEPQTKILSGKNLKKQIRRKCMSAGPVILNSSSKILRTLNVEEGEERYHYDVLDPKTLTQNDDSTAENVCVPHGIYTKNLWFSVNKKEF